MPIIIWSYTIGTVTLLFWVTMHGRICTSRVKGKMLTLRILFHQTSQIKHDTWRIEAWNQNRSVKFSGIIKDIINNLCARLSKIVHLYIREYVNLWSGQIDNLDIVIQRHRRERLNTANWLLNTGHLKVTESRSSTW